MWRVSAATSDGRMAEKKYKFAGSAHVPSKMVRASTAAVCRRFATRHTRVIAHV